MRAFRLYGNALVFWAPVFLLVLFWGCTPLAGKSEGSKELTDSSTQKFKTAMESDTKTRTGQPIFNIVGDNNSPVLNIPEMPKQEIVEAEQKKVATSDSWTSLTISEAWKNVSGWFWPLFAIAMAILYYIYVKSGAKALVHGVHQSMKGGLRAFNSIHEIFNHSMHGIEDEKAKSEVRRIYELIKGKESSLKAKAPNGDFKGRGHL